MLLSIILDGKRWRRLTRITKDEHEKLRPNFSTCANRDVAPLNPLPDYLW